MLRKKKKKNAIKFIDIPKYDAEDIKRFRKTLKLTRKQFSEMLGVSIKTVEAWENGVNIPNGSSSRLLQVINESRDGYMILLIEDKEEHIVYEE